MSKTSVIIYTDGACATNPGVGGWGAILISNEQIVEITMVSCMFNFWNRFTDSLQIDVEEPLVVSRFSKSKSLNITDYVSFMCDCWWNRHSTRTKN